MLNRRRKILTLFTGFSPTSIAALNGWYFSTSLTPTQVPDRKGNTRTVQEGRIYDFDSDSYIDDFNSLDPLNGASAMTQVVLIKPNSGTGYKRLFSAGDSNGAGGTYDLILSPDTESVDGNVYARIINDSGVSVTAQLAGVNPLHDVWCLLIMTYDGSNINIYHTAEFGSQFSSFSSVSKAQTGDIQTTTNETEFGRRWGLTGEYIQSPIAFAGIWDRAITEAERNALAQSFAIPSDAKIFLKMDEGAGATAYDSSGNGEHGTIKNSTLSLFHSTDWHAPSFQNEYGYTDSSGTLIPRDESNTSLDASGGSLEYSGRVKYTADLANSHCGTFTGSSGERAVAANDGTINPGTGNFAVHTYMKFNGGGSEEYVFANWNNTANSGFRIGHSSTSNKLRFNTSDGTTNVGDVDSDTITGLDGAWHHILYYADRDNDLMKFYVDGVLEDSVDISAISGNPIYNSTDNYTIGAGRVSGGQELDGSIAFLHYYNSITLTDAMALALVSNPFVYDSEIDIAYNFSEGEGSVLYDTSGNDVHAAILGVTLSTFWGTRQDGFHYNITKGFSLYEHASNDPINMPYGLDGSALSITAPTGYSKTSDNPAGAWHNAAETALNFPKAPALIQADSGINLLFDGSQNQNDVEYADIVANTSDTYFADVTTNNKKKNLLLFDEVLTDPELANVKEYVGIT